jgi:hypothetical protein
MRQEAKWLRILNSLPLDHRRIPTFCNQLSESGKRLDSLQMKVVELEVCPDDTMLPAFRKIVERMKMASGEQAGRIQKEIDVLIRLYTN